MTCTLVCIWEPRGSRVWPGPSIPWVCLFRRGHGLRHSPRAVYQARGGVHSRDAQEPAHKGGAAGRAAFAHYGTGCKA